MVERRLELKRVGTEAEELVQSVLDRAPRYRWNVDGVREKRDDARRELVALPPGKALEDKFFWVAFVDGEPFGVVDVIRDYPVPGTAFVGLFLLDERCQGQGSGRRLYLEIERRAAKELGATKLRLAVNDTNPVQGFWERVGFSTTGESKKHRG